MTPTDSVRSNEYVRLFARVSCFHRVSLNCNWKKYVVCLLNLFTRWPVLVTGWPCGLVARDPGGCVAGWLDQLSSASFEIEAEFGKTMTPHTQRILDFVPT